MSMVRMERNYSLDLTRIAAVLAVVMIHVSSAFVSSYEINTLEFQTANVLDSISRLGVPLFVMISGSLFLDEKRKISTRNLYFKNIKGILFLLYLWSFLYTCIYNVMLPLLQNEDVVLKELIKDFILGHYHMWYMFMIAGLYAVTPFLRLFVKKKNSRLVLLFIVLSVGVQFTVPVLEGLSAYISGTSVLIALINKFKLDFFCGYAVYYMLGWYIVHVGFPKGQKYLICAAGIISVILTVLYVRTTHDYGNAYDNLNLFILLYASGVMILLSGSIRHELSTKTKKALILLSRMSFGVYIIHPLLITIAKLIVPYHAQPLRYMLLLYLVVVCLSFLICYLFSKVPLARKLVRM